MMGSLLWGILSALLVDNHTLEDEKTFISSRFVFLIGYWILFTTLSGYALQFGIGLSFLIQIPFRLLPFLNNAQQWHTAFGNFKITAFGNFKIFCTGCHEFKQCTNIYYVLPISPPLDSCCGYSKIPHFHTAQHERRMKLEASAKAGHGSFLLLIASYNIWIYILLFIVIGIGV